MTLEDLIEELVGEIVDEYDEEEEPVESLPNGDVGSTPVPRRRSEQVHGGGSNRRETGTAWAGCCSASRARTAEGESVEVDGHRLTAERVQGRRIGRVRVSKVHVIPEDDIG